MLAGVTAELLEPVARTGAYGVGGNTDPDARRAKLLEAAQVVGHRVLAEAVDAASGVGDVEQDERDAGPSAAAAAACASASPR